jgi:hypothetical protein
MAGRAAYLSSGGCEKTQLILFSAISQQEKLLYIIIGIISQYLSEYLRI